MVRLILVIAGLMLSVSVGGFLFGFLNKETPTVITPSQRQASSSAQSNISPTNSCINPVFNFTVSYPQTWTTVTFGSEACLTYSLGEEKISEVKIDPGLNADAFTSLKASLENSDETRLLLNKAQTNREAGEVYKIEIENTGIGTFPKGTRSIYYLIDGSKKIVVSYSETTVNPQRDAYLKQLEELVTSIQLPD